MGTRDSTTDRTTVRPRGDLHIDPAVGSVEIDDVDVEGAEVMGALEVSETDRERGGVWRLDLDIAFATMAVSGVTVNKRLQEGTYALVRIDE